MKKNVARILFGLALLSLIGLLVSLLVAAWYLWIVPYNGDKVYLWMGLLFTVFMPLGLGSEILLYLIDGWDDALDIL